MQSSLSSDLNSYGGGFGIHFSPFLIYFSLKWIKFYGHFWKFSFAWHYESSKHAVKSMSISKHVLTRNDHVWLGCDLHVPNDLWFVSYFISREIVVKEWQFCKSSSMEGAIWAPEGMEREQVRGHIPSSRMCWWGRLKYLIKINRACSKGKKLN